MALTCANVAALIVCRVASSRSSRFALTVTLGDIARPPCVTVRDCYFGRLSSNVCTCTMGDMFTLSFWKDAAERTLRTFAQALLATELLSHPLGLDWRAVLLAAGGTAAVTLLHALASPAKSTAPVIATVPAARPLATGGIVKARPGEMTIVGESPTTHEG